MEWELSKENVQPLREGRNVEKLNASLKARMEAPLKAKISQEYRNMVEAIDAYTGDDPLKPWIDCIKWAKENFPSGGSQSRILQLLELCARTFCKETRYFNDLRYLKVWMDYADRCTNPREIYVFLQDNSIGQQHALFYEHCGRYLEQQQKFSQAQSTYDLGIARKAQPLDSLRTAYRRFLQRVSTENAAKDEAGSPPTHGHACRAFGTQIAGQITGRPCQQAHRNSAPKSNSVPQQLSVFVDPDLQPSSSFQRPHGSKFTTETERNKENIQRPSKWGGVKIPAATTKAIKAPGFKLDVFMDEDCIEKSRSNVDERLRKARIPASRALRLDDINGTTREEDKLKQNPLVYFEADDFL